MQVDTRQDEQGASGKKADNASPEHIATLATNIAGRVGGAISEIAGITSTTRLLSLNAQIEAARAGGTSGAAFAVVASAMQQLSEQTSVVAKQMANETAAAVSELERISKMMATNVRGTRLSDLALTNIDLIDRCLYERTCDCRWWATDSSVVDALSEQSRKSISFVTQRMGVILNAYTVYFDLVLCDRNGKIIANGRPEKYRSVGTDCSRADWFTSAMNTKNGDEFGFGGAHVSGLVGNQRVLVYSAGVREGAKSNGALLGVLGVIFNWDGLAQKIVCDCPLLPEEKAVSRVCIIDRAGSVIADSTNRQLVDKLNFGETSEILKHKKNFLIDHVDGKHSLIGHALSPGFETYATGWHSLIIQQLAS